MKVISRPDPEPQEPQEPHSYNVEKNVSIIFLIN